MTTTRQYAEVRVCECCGMAYRHDRADATERRCPRCARAYAEHQPDTPTPWDNTTECRICGRQFKNADGRGRKSEYCPECREIHRREVIRENVIGLYYRRKAEKARRKAQ